MPDHLFSFANLMVFEWSHNILTETPCSKLLPLLSFPYTFLQDTERISYLVHTTCTHCQTFDLHQHCLYCGAVLLTEFVVMLVTFDGSG